jgi:hypothetical protein
MQDNSGISLSVSDPDNNNEPQQYGDNGVSDAEDYCTAEFTYGAELAELLNKAGSGNSAPLAKWQATGGGMRRIHSKRLHGVFGYLALGGIVFGVFVGIGFLNRRG